jgi:hypothetical protein
LLDLKDNENILDTQMVDTLRTTSYGIKIIVEKILPFIKNEKKN